MDFKQHFIIRREMHFFNILLLKNLLSLFMRLLSTYKYKNKHVMFTSISLSLSHTHTPTHIHAHTHMYTQDFAHTRKSTMSEKIATMESEVH